MNILEFTRSINTKFSTHVRNKIVVGNYHVVQLVVNFGISTMLYVPVVARVDNLNACRTMTHMIDACIPLTSWSNLFSNPWYFSAVSTPPEIPFLLEIGAVLQIPGSNQRSSFNFSRRYYS